MYVFNKNDNFREDICKELIEKSEIFMLKNNEFDSYFSIFDTSFMNNNFIEEIFTEGLILLKLNKASSNQIWNFLRLFKESLRTKKELQQPVFSLKP